MSIFSKIEKSLTDSKRKKDNSARKSDVFDLPFKELFFDEEITFQLSLVSQQGIYGSFCSDEQADDKIMYLLAVFDLSSVPELRKISDEIRQELNNTEGKTLRTTVYYNEDGEIEDFDISSDDLANTFNDERLVKLKHCPEENQYILEKDAY